VLAALAAGRDVAFDIDWQGSRQVRAALPGDVVGLFILPPSVAELDRRLRQRGGDSEAEIAKRMAKAHDEMSHAGEFDHVLVNDDLDESIAQTRAVLHAARLATHRLVGLQGFLASGVG
jgi:guanylate kinase